MNGAYGFWRRRVWIWLPPTIALAAATLFLVSLARGVQTRGATLERALEQAQRDEHEARAALERLDKLAAAAAATRRETAQMMSEKFATESGRFTDLIREIKLLAEHAGLDPREIGYPEEKLAELGLVRRSFVFSVQGSYANLRAFLYLLELSPSFVTVDRIEVRELSGAKGLAVSLQLSTFFESSPGAGTPRTTATSPAAASAAGPGRSRS
ncbi:MAG: hypothetical protein ABI639_12915 [Thermoanaerobaculia bacterium]